MSSSSTATMQNVAIVLPGGTPASVNAPSGGHGSH
jgi:hypothetical protein